MLLPVLDVDICDPPNKKFEFALVEDIDKVLGNQLVESGYEGLELLLDSFLNAPFCDETIKLAKNCSRKVMYTYSTYSRLFSFVTSISSPPGFISMLTVSPNLSSSVEKVSSSASVISLFLHYD